MVLYTYYINWQSYIIHSTESRSTRCKLVGLDWVHSFHRHSIGYCICISSIKTFLCTVINRRMMGHFQHITCLLDQVETSAVLFNALKSNWMSKWVIVINEMYICNIEDLAWCIIVYNKMLTGCCIQLN